MVDPIRHPPADITVLYGSQTGNAEDMAKRVGLQAKLLGYRVLVQTMDDYTLKMLPKQRLVIFICSTTGHGQEPENMKNFYNFIRRRDLPRDCLSGLKYAVYGLGDSSYAKFNYVSKILFKRLRECSAMPLQELVAGDEQHQYGCDGIIYPKLDELWTIVEKSISKSGCANGDANNGNNSYLATLYPAQQSISMTFDEDKFSSHFKTKYNIRESICIANQRVTHETHFQDTRLLCFTSLENETIRYEPGDVCTIYPENSEANAQKFIELLNLNPKQRFKLTKKDPNYMIDYLYDFVPDGLTIEDLVRYYLDIQSIPKRSFFEFLWPFSDDQLERDKLKEFASTEGQEEVYDYCIRPKRSILETLMDFPNTVKNIQFDCLFDLIPPIKPRSFSIASAASVHPNEIHLIVGVVRYKTSMKQARKGLCSNFLASLKPVEDLGQVSPSSSRLRYFIRHTAFKLPRDDQVPIVMIGPGLGIAPFRGFIEDRLHRADVSISLHCKGENNHLYFGCRSSDKDYYFEHELKSYARDGRLTLRVAFSRQEPKHYVQDLLLDDAETIQRLIQDRGAIVYVAGNSKLPEELRTLFGKLLSCNTGDSEQSSEIERIVNQLEASNRIQYDCW